MKTSKKVIKVAQVTNPSRNKQLTYAQQPIPTTRTLSIPQIMPVEF